MIGPPSAGWSKTILALSQDLSRSPTLRSSKQSATACDVVATGGCSYNQLPALAFGRRGGDCPQSSLKQSLLEMHLPNFGAAVNI